MFRKLNFIVPTILKPSITIPKYIYVRELLVIIKKDYLNNTTDTTDTTTTTTINKEEVKYNEIVKLTEPTNIESLLFLNNAFSNNYNRISYLIVDNLNILSADKDLSTKIQENYFTILNIGFDYKEFLSLEIPYFQGVKGIILKNDEIDDYTVTGRVHPFVDIDGKNAIKFYSRYLSDSVLQPNNYAEVSGNIYKSANNIPIANKYFTKRLNWISDSDMINLDGGFCGDEEFISPYIKEELRILLQEAVAIKISQGIPSNSIGEAILETVANNVLDRYTTINNWLDRDNSQVIRVFIDLADNYIANTEIVLNVKKSIKRNIITAYEV